MKEPVKDFYGVILGWFDDQGDKIVATDFYGVILGFYKKSTDTTHDFYGRIICQGNAVTGLIMNAKE